MHEIAKGAASITGATLKVTKFESSFDNLTTNRPLSEAWAANMRAIGLDVPPEPVDLKGSTDMGNVSMKVPSIHPFLGLGEPSITLHTKEFAERTITDIAHKRIIQGAKSLAYTGLDLLTDHKLAQKVKDAFKAK